MFVAVTLISGNGNGNGPFLPILLSVEQVFEQDLAFRLFGSFSDLSSHVDNADITVFTSLP